MTLVGIVLSLLSACVQQSHKDILPAIHIEQKETLVFGKRRFIEYPQPSHFSICHGNTCAEVDTLSLDNSQWALIRSLFSALESAEQERQAIRHAVAQLEKLSGAMTGTDRDRGRNMSGWGLRGQMDCVDESTNTTVYLTMIQNEGLLRWHTLQPRVSRGIAHLLAPHFSAVIRQNETEQFYAVDSWFLDNGELPFVVPLTEWENGWEPDA
jgi:hypothetical protein